MTQHTLNDIRPTLFDRLNELLLVFLLIFTPLAYGGVQPLSVALVELTAALMALFWVLKMLFRPGAGFIVSPVLAPVLAVIAFASFQFFDSKSIYPWATKTEVLKLIAYVLIFLVTLNTVRTRAGVQRLEIIMITIGFFMSIFYLMRYFGAPAPRGFINPDHFSAYLDMIIPLSLGFFLVPSKDPRSRSAQESGSGVKKGKDDLWPLLIFFAIIMSAALFFTMSRGGMLSFMATLLFISFLVFKRHSLRKKGWIFIVIAGFIVLMLAWLGLTPVMERLLSIHAEVTSLYFSGRLPIWQGTLDIIKDHPLLGTGLGTFNDIFPKYQPLENVMYHYTYPHSEFLGLLAETGIAGFALTGVCILGSIVYLFRRYRERHDPWVTGMSLCALGSLASIFIHSWTDFNLQIPANAILLSTLLALLLSILNSKENSGSATGDRQPVTGDPHSPPSGHQLTADTVRYLKFHHRILRYLAALFVTGLLVIYGTVVVRPALANYYATIKPAGIQGLGAALRLDPSNAEYHYQLGRLYGRSGLYTLQRARYLMAVKLNPTNSEYRQSLAWVLGKKKDLAEARKEYESAIELHPNFYYPYQAYARWLLTQPGQENVAKGVAMYQKAVALNPEIKEEALEDYPALPLGRAATSS
ncbi:MAG: O-antigen ligase family protein [Candidatus Omnitrophota bacterium]